MIYIASDVTCQLGNFCCECTTLYITFLGYQIV